MSDTFEPCPFCGNGETELKENTFWTGMRSKLISVDLIHWCDIDGPPPLRRVVKITGKTREDAISAWSFRIGVNPPQPPK